MLTDLISRFAAVGSCGRNFFGLKAWYYYLEKDPQCNILNFKVIGGPAGSDFLLIALAIVDDLLRVAGLVAIGFVIYAGILYVTSQGTPEQISKAQNTLQNALIGLLIAILATGFVAFVGGRLGPS